MFKSIARHPLIQLLKNNKGNPRTLILMEPLWGIPFNLIAPFATLYMYLQGITDTQIGLILSISMVVQVLFSFLGGIITDKLGRKVSTMMGDFFGWSLACLIWAFSNNFWLFLIAVLFNSLEQINQTAWFCLLIEDGDEDDMLGMYTWIHIGGLVAVFFAPLAGFLIGGFSLIPVVRVLYLTFATTMFIKVILTYRYCDETGQGKIRMAETKSISVKEMLSEYKLLIPKVLKNLDVMKIVSVNVIFRITSLVSATFFGLYITRSLGVSETYLAFFPILNAFVMLVFMVGLQHKLEAIKFRIPMWIGLLLLIIGHILLISLPTGNLILIAIYVFLLAVANALIEPRRGALLQLYLDREERARLNALIITFVIAFTAPFGYLTGFLSTLNPRFPFILSLGLFLIAILIVGKLNDPQSKSEAIAENTTH